MSARGGGHNAYFAFTTVRDIYDRVPNSVNSNSKLIEDYPSYMKDNGTSERHPNNILKAIIAFAEFLGSETTFYQISTKDQVTGFLDTKIKSVHTPLSEERQGKSMLIATK